MRQTAGRLNRPVLVVLGILLLAAGITGVLQSAGVLQGSASTPRAEAKIVTGDIHAFFAQTWLVSLIVIGAVLIGLLALLWMIAQIPRTNPAGTYRLHREGAQGRTTCNPSVLAAVVEDQVRKLPDVVASSALLRGTADEPDLTLKVTVNDRADVRAVLRHLETSTLPQLAIALEAPLHQYRLQLDVSARTQNTGIVVRSTGTVVH